MSSNTENLGLYIDDPATDGQQYFDIEKSIGNNFKAIDEQLGVHLKESTKVAALTHGTQVIQGGAVPAIAFPKVDGRTLINLLGDAGACDDVASWVPYSGGASVLDTANKVQGSGSIKITNGQSNAGVRRDNIAKLEASKKYLIVAAVRHGSGTATRVLVQETAQGAVLRNLISTDTSEFVIVFGKFVGTDKSVDIFLYVEGTAETNGNVDAIRIYQISDAEYTAIDSMTAEQVAAKYPYLGTGIHGVKDARITNVQDNLIPDFGAAGWIHNANGVNTLLRPYVMQKVASGPVQPSWVFIPIKGGETYTLSYTTNDSANAYIYIQWIDETGTGIEYTPPNANGQTVVAPSNAVQARVLASQIIAGTFTYTNPMFVKGSIAQPFKPQSKTSLTAYTEVFSNVDGSVKDTLEYIDGKPKKLKRWEQLVMDGSFALAGATRETGFLRVVLPISNAKNMPNDESGGWYATKYDGKRLKNGSTYIAADYFGYDGSGGVYFSVSDTDSGWGQSYSPSSAEVKAYFNGWKMYNYTVGNSNIPYTGAGGETKGWVRLPDTGGATNVLPTGTSADPNWRSYNLLYQLEKPAIEDVKTHGALVLERGDNYVSSRSANVHADKIDLTYADSVYSTLSSVEREIERIGSLPVTKNLGNHYNANKLIANGRYEIWDAQNAPTRGTSVYYDVISRDYESSLWAMQNAYHFESNRSWTRRLIYGVWTPWTISNGVGLLNTSTTPSVDANTITKAGKYYVYTGTNFPTTNYGWYIDVIESDNSNYFVQKATSLSNPTTYVRNLANGNWTSWVEILTSNNLATGLELVPNTLGWSSFLNFQYFGADKVVKKDRRLEASNTGDLMYTHIGVANYKVFTGANNPASLTANGYQKLASGLIMQWGTIEGVTSGTQTRVTFPIAFPKTIVGVTAALVTGHATSGISLPSVLSTYMDLVQNSGETKKVTWTAFGY